MKNSKYLAMALMLSAMSSPAIGGKRNSVFDIEGDIDPVNPTKKPIPNGCKEYSFYGVTVIASNEKTAIKKCKKKAGIQ